MEMTLESAKRIVRDKFPDAAAFSWETLSDSPHWDGSWIETDNGTVLSSTFNHITNAWIDAAERIRRF